MEMTESQLKALILSIMAESKSGDTTEPVTRVIPSSDTQRDIVRDLAALKPKEVKEGLGRVMRALLLGGGTVAGARRVSRDIYGDGESSVINKLLIMGDGPSGGFLVPEVLSSAFIDILMPYAVVRSMGVTTMPMESGNMTINGGDTAPTAAYLSEAAAIVASTATFLQVKLVAKKLGGFVPLSNDIMRTSNPAADNIVAGWLLKVIANREDLAFIRGDGTADTPVGLRNLPNTTATMTATPTYLTVAADLAAAKLAMRQADLPFNNRGILMSPRTESYLENLQNTVTGTYPYKDEMASGKLTGLPYNVTTQIPENLGGGTESELYYVNFGDVIVGDTMNVRLDVSKEASYVDSSSVTRSAFQNDLTLLRAICEHDIGVQYDKSIYVITGLTWGV